MDLGCSSAELAYIVSTAPGDFIPSFGTPLDFLGYMFAWPRSVPSPYSHAHHSMVRCHPTCMCLSICSNLSLCSYMYVVMLNECPSNVPTMVPTKLYRLASRPSVSTNEGSQILSLLTELSLHKWTWNTPSSSTQCTNLKDDFVKSFKLLHIYRRQIFCKNFISSRDRPVKRTNKAGLRKSRILSTTEW